MKAKVSDSNIKVIGVGGGGVKVLDIFKDQPISNVCRVAVHADLRALRKSNADKTFSLGGPVLGITEARWARVAAENAIGDLRAVLYNSRVVFLLSAFGRVVGTGATPVIARTAKELGIPTIAIVSMPFDWETSIPKAVAAAGVDLLGKSVDLLVVVSSDTVVDMLSNDELCMDATMKRVNGVLASAAADVLSLLVSSNPPRLGDLTASSSLASKRLALMGTAVGAGLGRAKIAAEQAVVCPLLEGVKLSEAHQVLVLVTTAPGMLTNLETQTVMAVVQRAAPSAQCLLSTEINPHLTDHLRVTVIGVGLRRDWAPEKVHCLPHKLARRLPDAPVPDWALLPAPRKGAS